MHRPHSYLLGRSLSRRHHARRTALAVAITPLLPLLGATPVLADRVYGVDVSQYQGAIDWPTVKNSGGKSFAFIRASRGGTSGTSPGGGTSGTGLARYDDPQFLTNVNGATAAGILASPYHFARPDVTTASGYSATSTGADEAAHFLQIAGPWMKPGYILPVLDLEAGSTERSTAALSQWVRDFGNAIHAAKGIYPIVYTTSSYANSEIDATVPALLPNLWLARPNGGDTDNGDPIPAGTYPNAYGVWNPTYPNTPNPHPWKFWQYIQAAAQGTVPGIPAAIDLNVAHGDIEYLRDFQVPALWKSGSGTWSTQSNWNTDADPNDVVTDAEDPSHYYPYHNDITRGGSAPPGRLPAATDNVVLDNSLAAGAYTVTLAFPTVASVRRLTNAQTLNITGTLNVAKSLTISGTTNLTGGAPTVNVTESLSISAGGTLASSTGFLTLGTATTPATLTNAGTFSATGSSHVNIAANSSVTNSGTMTVASKTGFGNNLTVTNSGTLTLATSGGWAPGSSLINTAGSTTINNDAGSATTANLAVTAGGSLGVTFTSTQHLASLTIPAGGHATLSPSGTHPLYTNAFSIISTGQLQLADNSLVINYPSTSPAVPIRGYLSAGRLISSATDATHRLAYIDASQLPASLWSTPAWTLPDSTTLLVTLALAGDTNLDGRVDADDYARIDRSYAKSLAGALWLDGDFNYDGSVSSPDYLIIDTTFGQTQGLSPEFLAMRESQFGVEYVSTLLATVPEPTSLATCGLAIATTLLARRRLRR